MISTIGVSSESDLLFNPYENYLVLAQFYTIRMYQIYNCVGKRPYVSERQVRSLSREAMKSALKGLIEYLDVHGIGFDDTILFDRSKKVFRFTNPKLESLRRQTS